MALTRAQLLMGDVGQGVVLTGQAQGVRPGGNGITIRPDGVIEVDSQTIVGVMKLGQTPASAAAAYNGYTWPTGPGSAGQQLETDGNGLLTWADADGIDWTQKGQLIVGTGVATDVLLNAGSNLSMLIVDSSTPSGLNYTNLLNTAMQAPTGTTLQRPLAPDLAAGQLRYNDDTDKFEFYTGTQWEEIASGDPTPGGNTFVIQTIPSNIPAETGNALIPVGTTAERQTLPASIAGSLRYNSTFGQLEFFDGIVWSQIPGSSAFDFVLQTRPAAGFTASAVIPSGTSAQAEIPGTAGWLRYNTDFDELQFFNGTDWDLIAPSGGGVSSFVQAATPTARNVGDIWYDTVRERESVWDGTSWVQPGVTQTGPLGAAGIPAGTSLDQPPLPQEGYLRFNLDFDELECWNGGAWYRIGPSAGTVRSFVQAATPTAVNVGDLWYDTVRERESVWDGAAWVEPGVTQTGPLGAALMPSGTSPGDRPAAVDGMLRHSTTTGYLEFYDGARWVENAGGIPNLGLNLHAANSLIKTKVPEATAPITAGVGAGQAIEGSTYYDTNLGSTFMYYSNGGAPVWVMT